MRSYVRIYGPPILKAMKMLEKIAIDMPEVCIMDTVIQEMMPLSEDDILEYLSQFAEVPMERCYRIFSKSGVKVGEYDFYFEWFEDPSQAEFSNLIEKIDETLIPLGCKYTIATKPR